MSQERTEKATPKKREDAKKKGQVARGAEFPAALSFIAALMTIGVLGSSIFGRAGLYIRTTAMRAADGGTIGPADAHDMMLEAGRVLALIVLPVVAAGFVAVIAGNFAQGGISMTAQALKPKIENLNPAKNIKRIFGPDSAVNLLKALLKLSLMAAVAHGVLTPLIDAAPSLVGAPAPVIAERLGSALYSLALRCGLVFLALAAADYGYSRYKHEKSLRMTKQEIRDEYKEQEGDPTVKGQRRRAARALVQRRSLAEVPTASVVITNPTHFAVALRYDRDKDAAPMVVAKGADHAAAKIRAIARENGVPLVENPPLARAMFRSVQPEQMIPAEFFSAVAEVLAFVFRSRDGN